MLLSMTGYGEAHAHEQGLFVSVELRAINNRHFKMNVRTSEGYGALEPQIEVLVREHVRRGTLQLSLSLKRQTTADDYRFNLPVLEGYLRQLNEFRGVHNPAENAWNVSSLLTLPGVIDDSARAVVDVEVVWPIVEKTLRAALKQLDQMRSDEGRAMERDLRENCTTIATALEAIARRAPQVVEAYRMRLTEKLRQLLAEHGVSVTMSDIVREVGLFSERSDISEECVRLRSHLDQFAASLGERESGGRKLDFLTQEMFRETNTIGSKANDAEIARYVIEIKTVIERLREMVQNVE